MLEDGLGDGWRFAGAQGVVAPHHALQGGHLDHHVGDQVGFAQLGGAAGDGGLSGVQAQQGGQVFHQGSMRCGLIQHGAQLGLEGERAQARQVIFQRVLEVLADEEGRIGKAGADDVLVAVDDRLSAFAVA